MNWVTIKGVRPYDGRYEFDVTGAPLTSREYGWIKRFSGYMPVSIDEGFEQVDAELYCCFGVIALVRAGKIERGQVADVFDRLADAPFGSAVLLEVGKQDDAGDDAGPPASSSSGSATTSGDDSMTSSEISPSHPNGSGATDSDSSTLHPIKLAT